MAAAGVGIWAPGENPGTDDEALAAVKLAFEAGGGGVNDIDATARRPRTAPSIGPVRSPS